MHFVLSLMLLFGFALAFPRVGLHPDYTRLVFDLGAMTQYSTKLEGNTFLVQLKGQSVEANNTALNSLHVSSYQIRPSSSEVTVLIALRQGMVAKTSILGALGTTGRRLIVDVGPKTIAATQAEKTQTAQPQTTQVQSSASTAQASSNRPQKIVVLDAGHGGNDSGAVGYVVEKETTLDLALRLRELLVAQGVKVILTRDRDTALAADKRGDLGMRANAANNGRNVFVSLHVNSAPSIAQGIEVYYFGDTLDNSVLSQVIRENGGGTLGQSLTRESQTVAQRFFSDLIAQANLRFSRQLAHTVQSTLISSTGAVNRGVRQAPFFVIRRAQIPAVLVEVGFANHPVEGRKLASDAYRQTLAKALCAGIMKFLGNGSG